MKNLITKTVLTTMLSMVAMSTMVTAHATTFTDVNQGDWFYEEVMTLAEQGIVNGIGNGEFNPNGKVTEAEFVKMIHNATAPEELKNLEATDNNWYSGYYAEWLEEFKPTGGVMIEKQGYTLFAWLDWANYRDSKNHENANNSWFVDKATPENNFKDLSMTIFNEINANRVTTRAQASYIANEYLHNYEVDLGRELDTHVVDTRGITQQYFIDGEMDIFLTAYDNRAFSTAADNMLYTGIMTGKGEAGFAAEDELTRAEASAIIYRVINEDARQGAITTIDSKIEIYNAKHDEISIALETEAMRAVKEVQMEELGEYRIQDENLSPVLNEAARFRASQGLQAYGHIIPYGIEVCQHKLSNGKATHSPDTCDSTEFHTEPRVFSEALQSETNSWYQVSDSPYCSENLAGMVGQETRFSTNPEQMEINLRSVRNQVDKWQVSANHMGLISSLGGDGAEDAAGIGIKLGYRINTTTGAEEFGAVLVLLDAAW